MASVVAKTVLRAQVDEILENTYKDDPAFKAKVGDLIDVAYANAEQEEWDDVARRYERAFSGGDGSGRSEEGDQGEPGEVGADDSTRPSFESLVPDGIFAEYLEWTSEHESPAQYHFGAMLTIIASGLGRRPRIEWEARPLYPNLYTLLVGPSGARKGAAIDRALRLVVPAMGTNQLPNEGTHQGFAAALRKRLSETDDRADGLIVAPEFGVLMSRDQNKADLVKWLTDWYDSPDHWERALRGEDDYELRNVCVSVLGGSTMPWLRDMPSDAITGGFMPRFVLFDASGKRFWKSRPRFNQQLERELYDKLARIGCTVPEVIGWDTDSGDLLDDWYEGTVKEQYDHCTDEQFQKWLERKQSAAMKIAVVWQLADGGPKDVVVKEWLAKAIAVVDWGDHTVEKVYNELGVTQEGQAAADVMFLIDKIGGTATLRELCQGLKKSYTKSRIVGALNTLVAAGDIKRDHSPQKGLRWVKA